MHIIAGASKGRRLKSPKKTSGIKPIMGRACQSLFDSLRPYITASHFLDLFAGSGAVGMEALSRGASFVTFVEKSKEGLKLIDANVTTLNYKEKALVFQGDIIGGGLFNLRTRFPADFFFDIVFVAPPYMGEDRRGEILRMSVPTIQNVIQAGLIQKGARVIIQHHKYEDMSGMPLSLRQTRVSMFGETQFTYFVYEP